jgi:hypothetical protein
MNAGQLHRVPLSNRAIEILRVQHEARGDNRHCFPGARSMKPINDARFKSCSASWCATMSQCTDSDPHSAIGPKTRRLSRARSPSKRWRTWSVGSRATTGDPTRLRNVRRLMDLWAAFCGAPEDGKVVPLAQARTG